MRRSADHTDLRFALTGAFAAMVATILFMPSLATTAAAQLGPGSPKLALLCMGGPSMRVDTEDLKITVTFAHAPTAGRPEKPGECSLGDRPLADNEPTALVLTGGGQMATDLAALAAQPMFFSLLASPGDGVLEVSRLLIQDAAGGGEESNGGGPGAENNLGPRVDMGQEIQDGVAGPGTDTNVGGPSNEASATGPGAELYSASPPSPGPGSEGRPGTEGPGMQASASADTNAYGAVSDPNGQEAEGPGVQAPVVGDAASAALPADFSGNWHITGNVGEHFNLTLKATADGTITGTYFAGKAGAYPKGDIIGGRVTGSQLLAQYRYQPRKGESDTGQILFTLTGQGTLTAMWTDGDVVPSPDTAGGTWDGTR